MMKSMEVFNEFCKVTLYEGDSFTGYGLEFGRTTGAADDYG
jgi:hypothetical protein